MANSKLYTETETYSGMTHHVEAITIKSRGVWWAVPINETPPFPLSSEISVELQEYCHKNHHVKYQPTSFEDFMQTYQFDKMKIQIARDPKLFGRFQIISYIRLPNATIVERQNATNKIASLFEGKQSTRGLSYA